MADPRCMVAGRRGFEHNRPFRPPAGANIYRPIPRTMSSPAIVACAAEKAIGGRRLAPPKAFRAAAAAVDMIW
eukprot:CAMPEP_0201957404 /NCGR_PEP_ID=MMETSP0904-20121228/4772_1 /ASSEMBLY_ACC=CAM_ASM_000553 /TAXON_ID=420261 /ORGANISM="Thalassiosira antarctica, Strain CCMP982" /LENGTH=72 /DNA_ID=CAMNT_0048502403 /DNA_START=237 /DNA_END=453 /DNA_ORIENTATION=+